MDEAIELLRAGVPQRDIADAISVSAATVLKWAKLARADGRLPPGPNDPITRPKRGPPKSAADPPSSPTSAEEEEGVDDLVLLRRMQADMRATAREARAVGNVAASQRSLTAAANLAPVIARLSKASREDADKLHLSLEEINAVHQRVEANVRAILDRPLLCAHCHKQLSISYGTRADEDEDET